MLGTCDTNRDYGWVDLVDLAIPTWFTLPRNRRSEAMLPRAARWLWTVLITTAVVGFAAALVGCASAGPTSPVAVSDIKSVAGTWKGVIYGPGSQQNNVELTIREDGSYDLVSQQLYGASRGKGKVEISEGRLIIHGEKGRGVATVHSNRAGDRVMNVEATLSDNTILSARLWPSSY
jgi:hypothetical protein